MPVTSEAACRVEPCSARRVRLYTALLGLWVILWGAVAPSWSQEPNPLVPTQNRFKVPPPSIPKKDAPAKPQQQATDQPTDQPTDREFKKQEVPIDMHVRAVLQTPGLWRRTAKDHFWKMGARGGSTLLVLPITIETPSEPVEINLSYLKVKGGRALAWMLYDPYEVRPAGEKEEIKLIGKGLPQTVPFITKSFTITPKGTLQWSMYRFITGGSTIASNNLYAFKLNRELIDAKRPQPFDANAKVPSDPAARRAFIEARRRAMESYRLRQKQYVELIKRVNDAPDDFEMKIPTVVWAIFEVRDNVSELRVEGTSERPWVVGRDQLEAVRAALRSESASRTLEDGSVVLETRLQRAVRALNDMVTSESHGYNHRLAAYLFSVKGVYKHAGLDDTLYQLLEKLVKSPDNTAAKLTIKGLVTAIPPSSATAKLVKVAATEGRLDPKTQITALKSQLGSEKTEPTQVDAMLRTANGFLRDKSGPPPADILGTLLDKTKQQPGLTPAIVNGVNLADLPDDRLQASVVYLLQQAADYPAAAVWVDRKLLTGQDARLTTLTLATLGRANAKPESAPQQQPVRSSPRSLVRSILSSSRPSAPAPVPTTFKLEKPIPITHSDHSLLRNLTSDDAQTKAMSWAALKHFVITAPPLPPDASAAQRDAYQVLLEAAVAKQPTPISAVTFLQAQPDRERAATALAKLVIQADATAGATAAKALVGAGDPLGKVLLTLSYPERQSFGSKVYVYALGGSRLVTAVLGEKSANSAVVRWFGDELAAGRVPDASQWAKAYGPNDQIIELIRSTNAILRLGAIAALVADAGGDDAITRSISPRFDELTGASVPELRQAWLDTRKQVHKLILERSAGSYRLTLQFLGPAPAKDAPPPAENAPPTGSAGRPITGELSLGTINLTVEDGKVTLGNQNIAVSAPDGRQATIRLDNPVDLKNIANDELAKLPLEGVQGAVTLSRQQDEGWRGMMTLPDGRDVDLSMTPAK